MEGGPLGSRAYSLSLVAFPRPSEIHVVFGLIIKNKPVPWPGGSAGWSVVPYTKGCRFNPQWGRVQGQLVNVSPSR